MLFITHQANFIMDRIDTRESLHKNYSLVHYIIVFTYHSEVPLGSMIDLLDSLLYFLSLLTHTVEMI